MCVSFQLKDQCGIKPFGENPEREHCYNFAIADMFRNRCMNYKGAIFVPNDGEIKKSCNLLPIKGFMPNVLLLRTQARCASCKIVFNFATRALF